MGANTSKLQRLALLQPANFAGIDLSIFTQDEIQGWFSDIVGKSEQLDKAAFMALYSQLFPAGDAENMAVNAFTLLDTDKTGSLSVRELVTSICLSAKGTAEQRLYWAFNLHDKTNSGSLEKDAVCGIARTIMKLDPAAVVATASNELAAKALAWFDSMEKNGLDGGVGMSDFLEAAKKDTNLNRILSSETVVTSKVVDSKASVTFSNTGAAAGISNASVSYRKN
jgi:Ca2+-binding EF-hand superfamily protein